MYAGTTKSAGASSISDEYLLGKRRLDSVVGGDGKNEMTKSAPSAPKTLLADNQKDLEKDIARKLREDPLFAVKQQELAVKKKRALIRKVKKH
jgi:hypothetical protein